MKKAWLVVAAAGSLCAQAGAQDVLTPIEHIAPVVYLNGGPYSDRAVGPVWDNWTAVPTANLRALYNRTKLVEDVNFAPGPWASGPTGAATMVNLGFGVGLPGLAPSQQFIIRIEFYDTFSATGPTTVNVYSGTLIGTYTSPTLTVSNANAGGVLLRYQVAATVGPFLDSNCAMVVTLLDPATGLQIPDPVTTARVQLTVANAIGYAGNTGTTNTSVYRDVNLNGIIASNEGQAITASPSPAGYIAKIEADLPAPAPTCNDTLGSLPDGLTQRTNVTSSGVRWFCFTLDNPAVDQALTFLDIDTEGSAGDVAIAVYSDQGDVLARDEDSGSGVNAQLSFGVGRRPAVGDGTQYDGRNYDPRGAAGSLYGLNAGSYYLAVAPAGSTFSTGFTVSPAAGSPTYNLNLFTNASGTPAPASVPPVVDLDMGIISGPLPGSALTLDAYQQKWIRFEMCRDASDPSSFLDVDGQISNDIYAELFVFDSGGNLVTADAASGPGNRPQLSFGQIVPERPAAGDGLPFAGQDGNLLPGVYYVALGYDFVTGVPAADTQGNFHVRPVGGSSGFSYNFDFLPSWTDCGGPACDPDFNQDGNVDQDDLAYLVNVLGGGENPTGRDPDFNLDGNADQDDYAALLDVIAGGNCP